MVALDPAEMAARPLPIGVSMAVSIDTHQRGGPLLGANAPAPRVVPSGTADDAMQQADALVRALVNSTHTGRSTTAAIATTPR
jgi:membrane fusion protein (multidrug efflux system)